MCGLFTKDFSAHDPLPFCSRPVVVFVRRRASRHVDHAAGFFRHGRAQQRGHAARCLGAGRWLALGGAESGGGTANHGTLFKLDPGTATFAGLVEFSGIATGSKPFAGLLASDDNFYGTTAQGGTDGKGTIFQMLPDGTLNMIDMFRTATRRAALARLRRKSWWKGPMASSMGQPRWRGLGNKGVIFKVAKTPGSTPVTLVEFYGAERPGRNGVPGRWAWCWRKTATSTGVTENEGCSARARSPR